MQIEIPTKQERIATRYKDEITAVTDKLNNGILYNTLQEDNRNHSYVQVDFDPPAQIHSDELWFWLKETYLKGGWFLERVWGDEGSRLEGCIVAIKCFVAKST